MKLKFKVFSKNHSIQNFQSQSNGSETVENFTLTLSIEDRKSIGMACGYVSFSASELEYRETKIGSVREVEF